MIPFAAAPPPGGEAASSVTSAPASPSVAVARHAEFRVALGVKPVRESAGARAGNPVPIYYSGIGGLVAAEIVPPLGIRAGMAFYPRDYNDWFRGSQDSRFDGVSGDLDLTVSAPKVAASGFLPFVGLSGRAAHLTPTGGAAFPTYSLSLLLGIRMLGGFAVETRFPLGEPSQHPPAAFETTLGLWWAR